MDPYWEGSTRWISVLLFKMSQSRVQRGLDSAVSAKVPVALSAHISRGGAKIARAYSSARTSQRASPFLSPGVYSDKAGSRARIETISVYVLLALPTLK